MGAERQGASIYEAIRIVHEITRLSVVH